MATEDVQFTRIWLGKYEYLDIMYAPAAECCVLDLDNDISILLDLGNRAF